MLGAAHGAEQKVSSNYLSYIIGRVGVSSGKAGVVPPPPIARSSQRTIKSHAVNQIRRGREGTTDLLFFPTTHHKSTNNSRPATAEQPEYSTSSVATPTPR